MPTGRLDDARDILLEWSGAVSEGMLPNRFPDRGDEPEFNAVDASLWFVAAVQELLDRGRERGPRVAADARERMMRRGPADPGRLRARARDTAFTSDTDGLLACGEPGVQLTWMDARVGDGVITPRIGKPVEIQALWLNALRWPARTIPLARGLRARPRARSPRASGMPTGVPLRRRGRRSHRRAVDASCRPNQIFAVGGLPHALIDGDRARRVVDTVERRLLTPLGLRSLAPG